MTSQIFHNILNNLNRGYIHGALQSLNNLRKYYDYNQMMELLQILSSKHYKNTEIYDILQEYTFSMTY